MDLALVAFLLAHAPQEALLFQFVYGSRDCRRRYFQCIGCLADEGRIVHYVGVQKDLEAQRAEFAGFAELVKHYYRFV